MACFSVTLLLHYDHLRLTAMPTLKKRLNMSLPEDVEAAVAALAKRDDVPQATKALHLIQMALEIEEDDVWNAIAEKRDTKDAKFLSHEEAWA